MSTFSKDILMFSKDLGYPWLKLEEQVHILYSFCVELDENYNNSIDVDIEEGRYKELNHENVFVWHEYS
ncbi:MAG: hypothetical protein V2I33_25420 [Kangiellaceae bacterium]|jgi:hypothetical protein|nr:hypothetical protein [Kangiellaceae bacterium]